MLDERKARILQAIIEEHIRTGQPIGSRAVARRYRLGVSPATIRNEMADLEEMGYLDKPHTSSGRVPSDKGYRLYVDHLMPVVSITPAELSLIESLFRSKVRDAVSLLREMVRLVSETTNYLAFVMGPDYETTTYKTIHLLPASPGKALLVIVNDAGFVETCLIDVPSMTKEEIYYMSDMLTRELSGITLDQIEEKAEELLRKETSRYAQIIEQVQEFLRNLISEGERGERLYMGGAANLLSQPEFRDVNKVKDLFTVIESEELTQIVFKKQGDTDPQVRIGAENELDSVKDVSIVYGTFPLGRSQGRIGLLGPRRMDYAKAVAIVKFCEEKLSEFFSFD